MQLARMPMLKKMLGLSGIVLSIFILGLIDWQTGYELNFFVFYFMPVGLAAWFFGIELAVVFSILCALVWFIADKLTGHTYSSSFFAVWNTMIRLGSYIVISWSVNKIVGLFQSEKSKSEQLQRALSEIRVLQSFLSICCICKKIRNEEGDWQQMESYISKHYDTKFSHGYCPECAKKAMHELELFKRNRDSAK